MSTIINRLNGRAGNASICQDHQGRDFIACRSGRIYHLDGDFWRIELSPPYPAGVLQKMRMHELYKNSGYIQDKYLSTFLEILQPTVAQD